MEKKRKAVKLMKCPKCGINLLDHISVCPFCKTSIPKREEEKASADKTTGQNTGRFASVDPGKESYDFDLQYTLTFRDSGEIKQAIADMDAGVGQSADKKVSEDRKKPSEPRYTKEEMQEAALRAQARREGRKSSGKKKTSSIERRKKHAMRVARPTKSYADENEVKTQKSHKGLILGAGVLALVVILIIGIVNVCSYFAHKDPEYPTVYTKANRLYSYYDGKETEISSSFISMEFDERNESTKASSNDPKITKKSEITEKKLIKISESGASMFFLENVNMNTGTGSLAYYESGKKKSKKEVAQNVYYDIVVGQGGNSVLFVKNADKDGAHGQLCYWTTSMKEAVTIDTDIWAGNFKLAQDNSSVTYIKNFNPEVYTGDLMYVSLTSSAQPKRVDERVSFVFGTTPKSKIYFYAKEYDTKKGTYDLYIQSDTEGPKVIAEKGYLAPVISKKVESAYVFSNYANKLQTLNCVDLLTGANTKLADEVTDIVKVRNDDGAVIYSKIYDENKADYYFVSAKSPNPQKVASAIDTKVLKNGISLFDASNDFSRIAYVGGYDDKDMRGALYTMTVINDYAGSEIRISDDAYCCDVSADGAIIRFATSYNRNNNTVSLVSYSNANTLVLAEEVAAGAFTFDKTGEYAIYARDISKDTKTGDIESVNKKAKIKKLDEEVSAYGLKKDGSVILLKSSEDGQSTAICRTKLKGGKVKTITEDVAKVLFY